MLLRLPTLTLLLITSTALASPFPTRDQNPLLAGFGLPVPVPARIPDAGEGSFAVDLNWGSTATIQFSDDEALIVDAETRAAQLTLRRGLTDRIALQLRLPYRYTGGGTLDGFIDNWHDTFGLSDGPRNQLPQDDINIVHARAGTRLIGVDSSLTGIGDVSLDLGYALKSAPSSSASAWLSVKLPTGDADKLNGSGAIDVSAVIAGERQLGKRWSMFGQAGVSWLGEGDLLPDRQHSAVWSGLAGMRWQAFRGLGLKLQIDAHSAAFDNGELGFLGEAVILTLGGDYRFDSGWQVEIGVSEDITVEASPDVVFVLGIRREP